MSEQDKIQLKNELISEFRMKELESFVYKKQDDEDLSTMEEIQAEIDAVRQEALTKIFPKNRGIISIIDCKSVKSNLFKT